SIQIDPYRFIDTKSNLNSEVLEEIMGKIGLDTSSFELKANFIDESLIKMRNAIAHGEYRNIELQDFLDIYDGTMILIENFFNEILNFVVQKKFLLSAA
ncbi:MAE_28990/MAE_18760 family HEPN-like nuclease, partial [Acinetobacter baumannii]|nr:MAE_28990/MAE_18760 family HEPN-like nuclease [Acinetobacter baumannii]